MDTAHVHPAQSVSTALADADPTALAQRLASWGYKPNHAARVLRAVYTGGDLTDSMARRHRVTGSLLLDRCGLFAQLMKQTSE